MLATYGFGFTGSDATAPSRVTLASLPNSVTLSWYAFSGLSLAQNVSMET
jgi:hypothetical protein